MSSANDSDCEVEPIPRAAVDVNIGYINVIAILDGSCSFNAIHDTVFKRIREEEEDDGDDYDQKDENPTIELDMSIDNCSITVLFRVIPNLWTDMILGEDFLGTVNAQIHLEMRLFKWSHEDKLVITEMVENYDNSRAISGGSSICASYGTKSSEKEEIESTAALQESSTSKKKKKRTRKKKSNKKDPSTSFDCGDSLLEQLTLNTNDSAKKNTKKDKFVKIFIAEQNLWDFDGDCLSYYGIYSSQVNISVVKGEVLDRKEKNPLGYHMEALSDAFGEADEHGVTHLHILSENEDAINLMIAHQKKYKKYGDMDPEEFPRVWGLHTADDFINYNTACYGIPGYESLKFEYVPFDDEKYAEMVHVRKLVEKYIESTPM